MIQRLLIALLLCLGATTSRAQVEASITVDGYSRTYMYYDATASGPKKLIFVLHGTTQTGAGIADISLLHTLVDEHTIVCYPDGIGGAWSVGLVGGSTVNDVAFLDALIDVFLQQFDVDPLHIYSCGFSAGGYLSYRMACESAHCMAAIGSVAGVMVQSVADACQPLHGVPVMHFHGTSDFVVSYNGSALSGMSVNDVMAKWTNINGCSATPVSTPMPNVDPNDGCTVTRYNYSNCTNAQEVILYQINGGGHMWPDTDVLLSGLGTITHDINASQELVVFFNAHACSAPASVANTPAGLGLRLFPNPSSDWIQVSGLSQRTFVRVMDVDGRFVDSFWLAPNEAKSMAHYSSGVYYLQPEGQVPMVFVKFRD